MNTANLALRFLLELAALGGLGTLAWNSTNGQWRIVAVILTLGIAMTLWGVFAVPDDPSRSGNAPVPLSGWARLALELTILLGGGIAFYLAGHSLVGPTLIGLVLLHYALSVDRLRWLIRQ